VPGEVTLHRRDVQGGREVVDDRVEHGLDALVLERGAAQHRVGLAGGRQLADTRLDLLDRELLAAEVLLEQLLVRLGDCLDELGAIRRSRLGQVFGDLLDLVGLAQRGLAAPHEGLACDEVDDADEVAL